MTNPTSNFGWQMPTSTDLVTDLPADFEVFGQAVDTDFVDLLGGANGYILAKASAADLDFAWIPNDQGDITAVNVTAPITGGGSAGAVTIGINAATTSVVGAVQLSDSTSTTSSVLASTPTATKSAYDLANGAIAKSLLTTAGDVIYRNATVPVRLGIGTAGQVLAVNSGATAPEWKTPVSGKVLQVINAVTTSSVTNSSTSFADTGLTAAITPSATNSKILVIFTQQLLFQQSNNNPQGGAQVKLLRGANDIYNSTDTSRSGSFQIDAKPGDSGNLKHQGFVAGTFLDSPNTTSATTYKCQMALVSTAASAALLSQGNAAQSSIVLMEIGA